MSERTQSHHHHLSTNVEAARQAVLDKHIETDAELIAGGKDPRRSHLEAIEDHDNTMIKKSETDASDDVVLDGIVKVRVNS